MFYNSKPPIFGFRFFPRITLALALSLCFLVTLESHAERLDGGVITVVYEEPSSSEFLPAAQSLADHGLFDLLAEVLSQTFLLPEDITMRFAEIDEVNAYWFPDSNEIVIGYELIHYYIQRFGADSNDPESLDRAYIDAAFFFVLHEVGHALVAHLDLPVTGREEDAVDEFATLLLLQMDDELAESALVSAALQFADDAEDAEPDGSAYADEHSLSAQRFFSILHLVHGSDPARYQFLVDEGLISEDKAQYTADEYHSKCEVWDRLLSPHIRP